MAGRVFAFADPEIIQLAQSQFVPACADDWYQRRRTDAEGAFWKSVCAQGPRDPDAPTHQGIYVLTADGELLAFKNAGQDAKATREQLKRGLEKWNALPAARRQPGAIAVPDHGPLDPIYSRTPPRGGATVRVHARILDKNGNGYTKGTCDFPGGDRAARDFLWLEQNDINAMFTIVRGSGRAVEFPAVIAERILRFHFVDNTRGEPDFWSKDQIQKRNLTAIRIDDNEFRLEGEATLATDSVVDAATRGFTVKLNGRVKFARDGSLLRFDLVTLGVHRGTGSFTKVGERPARGLLGITFELADSNLPANRVAPQGTRDRDDYFGRR